MTVDRVRCTFSAGPGGNAYTNFYFGSVTTANLTALGALLTAIKALFPTYCNYLIPNQGDTLDEATGKIVGGWSMASPGSVAGTAVNAAPSLAGFLIDWKTGTVVNGHRPIGKTIIVPAGTNVFDSQGKVTSSNQSTVTTAATNFLASSTSFSIWHRPVYTGKPPNRVLTRPGSILPVNSGICNPNPTVLRSRRS